jgi:hypothetical protein
MSVCRFVCNGRGWPLLLVYVVRKWGMSCVIVLKIEGTQQAQVFEVLYVLHIHALEDVVYLCDKQSLPVCTSLLI